MMCMSRELIFAIEWKKEFNKIGKSKDTEKHIKSDFEKDCMDTEFIMDEGESFRDKYGFDVLDFEKLSTIIDDITNMKLIGSVIFSIWYLLDKKEKDSFLKTENKDIFLKLLNRLEEISDADMFGRFIGEARKITINSTDSYFPDRIMSNCEKEQRITINSNGGVWFSAYTYSRKDTNRIKGRKRIFKIDKTVSNNIIKTISDYFRGKYKWDMSVCDAGSWDIEITNTNGERYKYNGDTIEESYSFPKKDFSFSDMIRDAVGIKYMYLFDGNVEDPKIKKITIDYNRTTKEEEKSGIYKEDKSDNIIYLMRKNKEQSDKEGCPEYKSKELKREGGTEKYSEHLVIEGDNGTLEYTKIKNESEKMNIKYESQNKVLKLLSKIEEEVDLFENFRDFDDIVKIPYESTDYKITIDFDDYTPYCFEGSFDKEGLPENFDKLVKFIDAFIKECGYGEILDPLFYNRKRRHKSELIFCKVIFGNGTKSYYYLTDDDSIKIGDRVVVPAGYDDHKSIVKVVDIEYYKRDKVPLPIDTTKRIICKYIK